MKTTKGIITAALIFCYLFSDSQKITPTPAQWIGVHRKSIERTAYIFEATVLQDIHYTGKDQKVATCIMQITKIFKGSPQLKLGTIKVVTDQQDIINGYITGGETDGAQLAPIGKGGTFIIFGFPAKSSWLVDSTVTDNAIILTSMEDDSIVINGNSAKWVSTYYKTLDELYSFFKENGLTVQEEQK
jgi:hypothetical protein